MPRKTEENAGLGRLPEEPVGTGLVSRSSVLLIVVAILFGALLLRVLLLQTAGYDRYRKEVVDQLTTQSEVLADRAAEEEAAPKCLAMAGACLRESILPDGSMIYEYNPVTREIHTRRSWWVQAETVVGFLNAWQMSGEDAFLDASLNCFQYIDRFLVDHEYGEWFTMLGDSGKVLSGYESKIDGWKCPYHNARMCFEIIERYEKA